MFGAFELGIEFFEGLVAIDEAILCHRWHLRLLDRREGCDRARTAPLKSDDGIERWRSQRLLRARDLPDEVARRLRPRGCLRRIGPV
jgi:hypothetical protein